MEKGKKTSSSKKIAKSLRAKSRKAQSTQVQPDTSGSSAMEYLNTGSIPKTTGAVPKTTGAVPKTTGAIPKTTGAVPKTTGAVPKKKKSTKVQPDSPESSPEIIKKIKTCFIAEEDEDKYVKKGLAQASISEISHPPEKKKWDYQYGKSSTSTSEIPDASVDELLLNYLSGEPSTSTTGTWQGSVDPQSSEPSTGYSLENLDDLFHFTQEAELPLNIFDSSDEETLDSIGDIYYKSPLTKEQQEKEERMTKIYMEQNSDSWEFYGKGSSDFDIPLWTPPEHPPISAFGMPLNHLEKAATDNLSVIPEVVLDSD